MTTELELMKSQINCLRNRIHQLILDKENLDFDEVIKVSQLLDRLLNEYYSITMDLW